MDQVYVDQIRVYTTSEISKILSDEYLDVPVRRIKYYLERGYIQPSIRIGSGQGSRRLWSEADIVKIYIIRKCEVHGCSGEVLRGLIKFIGASRERFLVISSDGSIAPSNLDEKELRAFIEVEELSTIIPIEQIGGEAVEKIKAFY